jgi:radical SAM superfamily enzyme YgiQ (UPF0313 family)
VASLKDPGAILLVSCYELGRQPLSVASPAATLRQAGFAPAALDLARQHLDPEAVRRARLVAIAVPMHTALRLGVAAAERIRALNPGAHLCFYGLYASLNAATLIERGATSIIGGECEEPLLNLAESLERGGMGDLDQAVPAIDAAPVPGVRTAAHAAGPWIKKVPLAVPDRSLLPPLDGYVRLAADGAERVAGHVEASRGCLHLCRHCPIPPVYGGRFFVVPQEIVIADIRAQIAAGASHITFGDPDFLNGPGHALAVARAMHAEFPRLTFDFTAKVEHLLKHRYHLEELRRLGCLFIVTAAESLSDRVLAILAKGHTRADIETAIDLARGAGIALRPTWVPFTPWTGLDDYRDLLEFVAERDLVDAIDPVQLSIRLLVPPGSLLADHPDFLPHRGPLDAARLTWAWTHPDLRVDRLQRTVSRLVEGFAGSGGASEVDPGASAAFERIAAAADDAAAGGALANGAAGSIVVDAGAGRLPFPPSRLDKGRVPRLTEPWFC